MKKPTGSYRDLDKFETPPQPWYKRLRQRIKRKKKAPRDIGPMPPQISPGGGVQA